jgi:hypothetical protein
MQKIISIIFKIVPLIRQLKGLKSLCLPSYMYHQAHLQNGERLELTTLQTTDIYFHSEVYKGLKMVVWDQNAYIGILTGLALND